jgi:hypothetical protein
MDFQNYDYEMVMMITNITSNAWVYLYWNGASTGTYIGDMIYTPNVGTFGSGSDSIVPYHVNDIYAYFVNASSSTISSDNRDILARYRFRGISSTRFSMAMIGRMQLWWNNNATTSGRGAPGGSVQINNCVWAASNNNINWAPTSITLNGLGSATVKITWLRINKVSSG